MTNDTFQNFDPSALLPYLGDQFGTGMAQQQPPANGAAFNDRLLAPAAMNPEQGAPSGAVAAKKKRKNRKKIVPAALRTRPKRPLTSYK